MHDIWKDMFVMGLPLLEKVLRPIIVYAFLVVSLRLSGKRELVQLNPFDLVVLLTLSNTVQNAIIGEDNSVLGGLIGATSLLVTGGCLDRGGQGSHQASEDGAYHHGTTRSCRPETGLRLNFRRRTVRP